MDQSSARGLVPVGDQEDKTGLLATFPWRDYLIRGVRVLELLEISRVHHHRLTTWAVLIERHINEVRLSVNHRLKIFRIILAALWQQVLLGRLVKLVLLGRHRLRLISRHLLMIRADMQLLVVITVRGGIGHGAHLPHLVLHIDRWGAYRVIHNRFIAIELCQVDLRRTLSRLVIHVIGFVDLIHV